MTTASIQGLDEATRVLGGALLGPRELATALGYDPLGVLTAEEARAVARIPFSRDMLARAKVDGEILVLRVPRDPDGPLTMLRLADRLRGGLDARVHKGVGYTLREEWTIDAQPFATTEVCTASWWLVARTPAPTTFNRTYEVQERRLADLPAVDPQRPRRRSAVEIAYDTLLWQRAHGERLLAETWDWSRSASIDQGYAALGEFNPDGLKVIAYSRAVRFGTLGVCPQH